MTPSAVSVGELQHVSASQITGFKLCNRRWWFEKVAKFPSPSSPAAELGGDIHRQMEAWYEEGQLPEHPSARLLVQSGLIPDPGPPVLIEHPRDYQMDLYVAGVRIKGRIDLYDRSKVSTEGLIDIWDWKSKADFRYAKRPDELERDVQMIIYGKYAFSDDAEVVRFIHGNIKTGQGSGYKIVKTDLVYPEHVDSFLKTIVEPVVYEMKTCATATQFDEAKPNFNSCYAFNKPCPFLEKCTVNQSASVYMSMLFKDEGESTMGLGEKLKTAETTSTRPGLTLYINAMPVKGVGNITYLDDIIAEASAELCAKLTPIYKKEISDLRMVPYGEGKGHLAAGIRQNPPTGVVVATTGELSDVAIEALLPLADVVIRGTR